MPDIVHDIRIALRRLRASPGFTAAAVLTLGLGIGLEAAVLTVARSIVLRPLPVLEQERLLLVTGVTSDGTIDRFPVSPDGAAQFADGSRALEAVAYHLYGGAAPVTASDGDRVFRIRRALVSGNWFDVLGAPPLLGRALREADDLPGAAPVVVLSEGAWRRRFGADPAIVGRSIRLEEDGRAHTVVGVMPARLDYPRQTEIWAAFRASLSERVLPFSPVNLVGRLRPWVAPSAARDEMTAFFRRPEASVFEREVQGLTVPFTDALVGDVRPAVVAFSAAAGLLLLIACTNVANLLLIRGLRDARDVAVRIALGGSRARIVAQRIVEHALLGLAAALFGAAVAVAALRALRALAPESLPPVGDVALGGVLLGAVALALASVPWFGVLPAAWAARVDPQRLLRADPRQGSGRSARWLREALVTGQVALAVLVLSAAALIGRSLLRLQRAELGLDPSGVLVAELAWRLDAYPTPAAQRDLLDAVQGAVRALPGVVAVSPAVAPPFTQTAWDGRMTPEGGTAEEAARGPLLNLDVVAPDYFAAVGLPVLRGRAFDDRDREGGEPVVVLSEGAASRYWPGEDPIGRRVAQGQGPNRPVFTVVGVVPDARYRDLREARTSVYFPLAQSRFPFMPTTLVLRLDGRAELTAPALREAVRGAGPDVTLASVAPFEDYLAGPLGQPRMNALLLAVFGGAAVALSAVGLAAVLAAMVRQRRHELGVRMALGATAPRVRRLVWARGVALAAIGAAVGLAVCLPLSRLWAALLFETTPMDPATLAASALAVVVVAGLASLPPARSSSRIQPMDALRTD